MATRNKYLLSNGLTTTKVEEYILDLLDLYIKINPGDIPGLSNLGFNFTFTNVMKDELDAEINYRLNALIDTIKSRVIGVPISIESIILIDETRVKLVLQINGKIAEDYYIDLYE